MLEVNHLNYSYGNNSSFTVQDVNFSINHGEIFGFLGPSGAGKSTTQNILIGLLPLQKGNVLLDGNPISFSDKNYLNSIGVSFEAPNVYRKLTGLDNLNFYKKMFDVNTEDSMQLLRMVGLEDSANKKAENYSKGMLQRLVFARSMINHPKIWFLDEPTSGLDPTTAQRIKNIIKKKKESGIITFLTTHNMYIAEELCDTVAFIDQGKLSAVDSPRNLKIKYGEKLIKIEYLDGDQVRTETLSTVDQKDKSRLNDLISNKEIVTLHSQEATLETIFTKVTGRGLY